MMTGIGVTMEALSIRLHLSENRYDTAWAGAWRSPEQERVCEERDASAGLCLEPLT